jgi:hypothetical protein
LFAADLCTVQPSQSTAQWQFPLFFDREWKEMSLTAFREPRIEKPPESDFLSLKRAQVILPNCEREINLADLGRYFQRGSLLGSAP